MFAIFVAEIRKHEAPMVDTECGSLIRRSQRGVVRLCWHHASSNGQSTEL